MEDKLLQKLSQLLDVIMEAQVKVESIHTEFHKFHKKDYDALQDLMTMKNSIDALIISRANLESKIRERCEDAIANLLLDKDEKDDYQECNFADEVEDKVKSEPEEINEDVQSDYDPDWYPIIDSPSLSTKKTEDKIKCLKKKRKIAKNKKPPTDKTKVVCATCHKMVKASLLEKHLEKHSTTKRRPSFSCSICANKEFSTKGNLTKHLLIHEEKKFICEVCSMSFHQFSNLVQHKRKHGAEKPFSCSQCNASFKFAQCLKAHVLHNHSENGVQCSSCGLIFSTSISLNNHFTNVHDKDSPRPFDCKICEKRFKRADHLKYHMTTHSNPNSKTRGLNKNTNGMMVTAAGKPRIVRNKFHQKNVIQTPE